MRTNSWTVYSTTVNVPIGAEKVQSEGNSEKQSTESIVRVNIQLESDTEKKDVIERISREVFDGNGIDIKNENLAEGMFTANVPSNSIEAIKAVSGVKDVTLVETGQVLEEGTEQNTEFQEQTEEGTEQDTEFQEQTEEIEQNTEFQKQTEESEQGSEFQVAEETVEQDSEIVEDSVGIQSVGIVIFLLIIILGIGSKLHKRFR